MNAYLDDTLTPEKRQQVERDISKDANQRTELDQLRFLQQQMRQLPLRRVRRNFTLDPTLYGRPRREPLVQAYPVLRTATVMAAFFFIFALAANLFLSRTPSMISGGAPVAFQTVAQDEEIAEVAVEEMAVESAVMEAEPIEEAADSIMTEAETLEEMPEAEMIAEEMAVDPEFEPSADGIEFGAVEPPAAPQPAELMESIEALPAPTMASSSDDSARQALPTTTAVEGMGEDMAEVAPASPPAAATAIANKVELLALPTAEPEEKMEKDVSEIQYQTDELSVPDSGLGLIVLLLGIIFVILVVLTLLARRRL